jgi:hypothetical protein
MDISSSTAPNASAVFYDKGFIYLGTEKGDSPELTVWSVADPAHPQLAGRYEIGGVVKNIFVNAVAAYIASTNQNQLMVFNVSDPTNPILTTTSAPSGWQTQSGQALDFFQGDLALGRNTGGFNVVTNPEFIEYSATNSGSIITQKSAFDEPGGIYAAIARPPHFLALTHRAAGQLRSDDDLGKNVASYDIPGTPVAMSCDNGNVYVASNSNPAVTLVKDFHE